MQFTCQLPPLWARKYVEVPYAEQVIEEKVKTEEYRKIKEGSD